MATVRTLQCKWMQMVWCYMQISHANPLDLLRFGAALLLYQFVWVCGCEQRPLLGGFMREMAKLLNTPDPDPLVANPQFGLMGCSSLTSSNIKGLQVIIGCCVICSIWLIKLLFLRNGNLYRRLTKGPLFLYSFWWLCAPPPRQLEVSGGMG